MRTVIATDVTGRPVLGEATPVRFQPINLARASQRTSIRTDISGSHGHSKEEVFTGRVLFEGNTDVLPGDTFTFNTFDYEVTEILPRYDRSGYISHIQADLSYD